jgi:hypothetical protein
MYICTYERTYVCLYERIYVCMYVRMYVSNTHACTMYVPMYANIFIAVFDFQTVIKSQA